MVASGTPADLGRYVRTYVRTRAQSGTPLWDGPVLPAGVPTSTLQKVTQYRKTLGAFCESASIVATPARANNTAVPVPNANSIYEPPY